MQTKINILNTQIYKVPKVKFVKPPDIRATPIMRYEV